MKTFLTLAMLLLAATAQAQLTTDAAYGVSYNPAELRLDYLPQDGDKHYLTIFATGQQLQQTQRWFDSNAELKRWKDSTHFSVIDTNSEMFRKRYAASTPNAVTIRYQRPDGTIVKEWRDGELPLSGEAFIRLANAECFRRSCPNGRCQPNTDPEPQPLAPPAPRRPAQRFPWLLLGIVTTVSAASGAIHQSYKTRS